MQNALQAVMKFIDEHVHLFFYFSFHKVFISLNKPPETSLTPLLFHDSFLRRGHNKFSEVDSRFCRVET